MQLQLNTDNNIQSTEALKKLVSESVHAQLRHYLSKITRIEVHLSDQNAHKSGPNDILCKMEARVEGTKPVFVTSKSDSKEVALDHALDKMRATLSTLIGKITDR